MHLLPNALLIALAVGVARPGHAQASPDPCPLDPRAVANDHMPNATHTACADRTPALLATSNSKPTYPASLTSGHVEGQVSTSFIVDRTGSVDSASIKVSTSTNPLLVASVRKALAHWRGTPAQANGRPIREMLHHTFYFVIPDATSTCHLPTVLSRGFVAGRTIIGCETAARVTDAVTVAPALVPATRRAP